MPPGWASPSKRAVALLDDDVSLVNTDPELEALILGHPGISLGHALLDLNSTAEGFNYACELGQHLVPGGRNDPAAMLCNLGGHKLAVEDLKLGKGALLVSADETAVTRDVCSKDRREPGSDTLPLHAQSS